MGQACDPRDAFLVKALGYLKMRLGPNAYTPIVEARCRALIADTEPSNLLTKFDVWLAEYFGSTAILCPTKVETDVAKRLETYKPYRNPKRIEISVARNIAVIESNPSLNLEVGAMNKTTRYWRRNH